MLGFNGYGASEGRKVEGYGGFMLGALFASALQSADLVVEIALHVVPELQARQCLGAVSVSA